MDGNGTEGCEEADLEAQDADKRALFFGGLYFTWRKLIRVSQTNAPIFR